MNIHFIIDSIYSKKFIDEVKKSEVTDENVFYCLLRKHQGLKYLDENCVKPIIYSNRFFLFFQLSFFFLRANCKRLYVHFLNEQHAIAILSCFKRVPVVWGYWGGDLYNYIDYELYDKDTKSSVKENGCVYKILKIFANVLHALVINHRIDYVTMKLPGEYRLLKQFYPRCHIQCINFEYQNPIDYLPDTDLLEKIDKDCKNIMVGNSGDPSNNHLSILHQLSNMDGSFNVILPLSYGNKDYIDRVIAEGKKLLGSRFVALTEFYTPEVYMTKLKDIDVCIMNHYRQQGLGNIRFLLSNGVKLYLNKKNPLFEYFISNGMYVFGVDSISSESIWEFSDDAKKNNSRIINDLFSEKTYNIAMKDLFFQSVEELSK